MGKKLVRKVSCENTYLRVNKFIERVSHIIGFKEVQQF